MDYDVVSKADEVVRSIKKDDKQRILLTTSQIRKFLTAVSVLKNKVDVSISKKESSNEILKQELADELKFLKVNIAYQAGRDKDRNHPVKDFASKSELDKIIDDIGNNTQKFYKLCKYVEALVAYHKYYGGKEGK
ncbi:MAG: type III-A CRISPR-associated protein Csm2 [Phascolarctobacterium sp.]|nr:type III-A CRISPR-associated protein Csm2 [Candidatus Phascolarctobacterium caballi]